MKTKTKKKKKELSNVTSEEIPTGGSHDMDTFLSIKIIMLITQQQSKQVCSIKSHVFGVIW